MAAPTLTITFLGTGTSSGVPMVACPCHVCTSPDQHDKRLRSSILVQSATTTIVVDTTPDFRQQMLTHQIKTIDAVLITHPHKDHIGGLDDTRAFQYFQQQPTSIYGNSFSIEGVKKELPYAFEGPLYPGVPSFDLHEIDLEPFIIGDIPVIPIMVWHHKLQVYGYRFGDFVYITDANNIDESEKQKIRDCKIFVVNALRYEQHISHYSMPEAIAVAQELNVEQTYFTHVSHQLGRHVEVNAKLPETMQLAYDNLQLVL